MAQANENGRCDSNWAFYTTTIATCSAQSSLLSCVAALHRIWAPTVRRKPLWLQQLLWCQFTARAQLQQNTMVKGDVLWGGGGGGGGGGWWLLRIARDNRWKRNRWKQGIGWGGSYCFLWWERVDDSGVGWEGYDRFVTWKEIDESGVGWGGYDRFV